jgi:hypothetical protein
MANNVGFAFSVGDTIPCTLQLVLSKVIRNGDTISYLVVVRGWGAVPLDWSLPPTGEQDRQAGRQHVHPPLLFAIHH